MAYTINKTDGSVLATVTDGTVNTDTTLTIIGKNYAGYGEFIGENFVKLLENSSNASAPVNPLKGQLWFDSSTNALKVFNGSTFISTGSGTITSTVTVSPTSPTTPATGELWFDTNTSVLKIFNGSAFIPAVTVSGTVMTDVEVKTAYENNADTNAFSDVEKAKLQAIEASATADQTKTDIDALGIDAATVGGSAASAFATTVHAHTEYSPTAHTHTEYSPTAHTHTEYSPTAHTHTDLASLSGATFTGDINMGGNVIDNVAYTAAADATLATGIHTFDHSLSDMQQLTATGNIEIAFSGFVAGKVGTMVVDAVNWGAHTITLPVGMTFNDGVAPTFTLAGTDRIIVLKDKNDVYSMFVIGQNVS